MEAMKEQTNIVNKVMRLVINLLRCTRRLICLLTIHIIMLSHKVLDRMDLSVH